MLFSLTALSILVSLNGFAVGAPLRSVANSDIVVSVTPPDVSTCGPGFRPPVLAQSAPLARAAVPAALVLTFWTGVLASSVPTSTPLYLIVCAFATTDSTSLVGESQNAETRIQWGFTHRRRDSSPYLNSRDMPILKLQVHSCSFCRLEKKAGQSIRRVLESNELACRSWGFEDNPKDPPENHAWKAKPLK
ncbi:hypothetical protein FB45DRAFT_868097 [Roridomyces roridus]|uniref:Uncharacterized protein n=1 Tax=Roridomyces roridus TaxID=1738132 RepID=A0AAD7BPT0_9AGAR|nr:hypothetical protein FB45DRAFT_868097 [Roridomyces roridus]